VPQRVHDLLLSIFEAARLALADGIHNGFVAGMITCILVVIATLFLKDVPLSKSFQQAPTKTGTTPTRQEGMAEVAPMGH
jgi:hypothetical protein